MQPIAYVPADLRRYRRRFAQIQPVIVNFLVYLLKTLVDVSRKKSYLDTVRQPNYWSGKFIGSMVLLNFD